MLAAPVKTSEWEDLIHIEKSGFQAVKVLLRYGRGMYAALIGCLLLLVGSAACVMLSAHTLGILAEELLAGRTQLTKFIAIIIACEVLNVSLQYVGRVSIAYLTNKIAYNIRCGLFAKIARLPILYFDRQPFGRNFTRLTSDVEGVEDFFGHTLTSLLVASLNIGMVFFAMILTDLRFGMIVVLISLPALLLNFFLRKPLQYWLRLLKKRNSLQNSKLAEFLNGLPLLKVFGLENWTKQKYDLVNKDYFDASIMVMNWNCVMRPLSVFFSALPTIFILYVGGMDVLEGGMSIALFVAFVRYSERFLNPIVTISQEVQRIQDAMTSSERIRQMLSEPEENDIFKGTSTVSRPLTGKITFKNVSMAYSNDHYVIKDINFDIAAGKKVAFVGATGSGKSTTMHLIPRLYNYQKGQIFIDDIAIEDWQRSSLRSGLGVVSQEIIIFRGTLRQNLLAALSDERNVTDEEIMAACTKSGLVQIWQNFPMGLQSWIVDGGENLSVGERQLIAFTRMFLRNPAILMLDEATASIDRRFEEIIQGAIEQVMEGRTCIIIAHRLSTIKNCDLILVFAHGEIIERGTHDELVAKGGSYAQMVGRQTFVEAN